MTNITPNPTSIDSKRRTGTIGSMRKLGVSFLDILAPPICDACDRPLRDCNERLCSDCWAEFRKLISIEYCRTCGDLRGPHLLIAGQCANCRLKKPGHLRFDAFACVGRYDGPMRELILRIKHRFTLDHLLGQWLGARLQNAAFSDSIDYWIPVPSHWFRRLRRGFQPTRLLAETATKQLVGELKPILKMRRHVPEFHRYRISATARRMAIKGAFKVSRGVELSGKCVCLIDDVMTTGATLAEAAKTLRTAGAKKICVAVVAKTAPEQAVISEH